MRPGRAGLMAVLMALSMGGAGCAPIAGSPADAGKTVLVLFDLSGSAKDMVKQYLDGFDRVMAKVGPGDRIVVERISEHPLTDAVFPVNETFIKYGAFDRRSSPIYEVANRKDLDDQRARIHAAVEKFLTSSGKGTTAVMDSLEIPERVFHTYPEAGKVLVVFSDMVESSADRSFAKEKLDTKERAKIIEERRSAGKLSDLAGVKVYVIGAGAGEKNNQIKTDQWFDIASFWKEYFQACGADFSEDRYGSALIDF